MDRSEQLLSQNKVRQLIGRKRLGALERAGWIAPARPAAGPGLPILYRTRDVRRALHRLQFEGSPTRRHYLPKGQGDASPIDDWSFADLAERLTMDLAE